MSIVKLSVPKLATLSTLVKTRSEHFCRLHTRVASVLLKKLRVLRHVIQVRDRMAVRTSWSKHGASRARVAALPNGASNPDHRSAEGISTPRQSRQFGSGTLRRTVEVPRRSKPNRVRIPPEYLPERNGSFN